MAAFESRDDGDELPFDLRDALTRSRLELAVARLGDVDVLGFDRDWWDGQAHAPCLVVRGGRRHRLLRVVETGGEAFVVPFEARTAARWIADHRGPAPAGLGVPAPRAAADLVVVDASGDVLTCASSACGALLPVAYDGACPVCGGDVGDVGVGDVGVSEEKSTATGARTAGSSTSK